MRALRVQQYVTYDNIAVCNDWTECEEWTPGELARSWLSVRVQRNSAGLYRGRRSRGQSIRKHARSTTSQPRALSTPTNYRPITILPFFRKKGFYNNGLKVRLISFCRMFEYKTVKRTIQYLMLCKRYNSRR